MKEVGKALLSSVRARLGTEPPLIGNAPLDPFGQESSPQQLAGEFSFLRGSALISTEGELPRYQDLQRGRPEVFYSAGEVPPLVLFLSHRWQTPVRPDPDGQTLGAVRSFLRGLAALATAAASPPRIRAQLIPSLRIHGIMQAAILLGNGRGFGMTEFGISAKGGEWQDFREGLNKAHYPSDAGDALLHRIAVFYDFSCIPQGVNAFGEHDDENLQQAVVTALRRMHVLIAASTVLAVRSEDDDYGSRGWCVAELSIGRPEWRHLVLRTDLLGQRVTDTDLLGESPPSVSDFESFRQELLKIDDDWRSAPDGWRVLRSVATNVFFGLLELEADRSVPVLVTPHAPQTFPGHKALLTAMMARLSLLSDMDRALDGILPIADIAELVTYSLMQAGLHCTVPEDRVYVGLQMLYARHVGAPQFARFYGDCLQRYVERRTTRLARYREMRKELTMRAWWVFADEPKDSDAWRIPKWAKS